MPIQGRWGGRGRVHMYFQTNPHHDQSWYEDLKGKMEVGRGTGPAFAEDGEISLRCGTVHAAAHTEMLSDVSVGYNWV